MSEGHMKYFKAQPDEALFYKFRNYFPAVEPDTIRQLLAKY